MRWPLAPSLTPRLCLTAKDGRSATGGNWHDGTRNEHMSGSDFLLSHDFIDLFDDGLLLVQDNGAVEAANAAAIRSFGKQLVGTNIEFLFPGSGILALFKQASESQSADEISYAHDGAVDLVFKVRACRMNANLVAILFLDMTFQRNLDNVRRDFVANVSHELRSPLTSLAGFVETMLTQNVTDPEMQHRFLMIMQEEAQRMSRLLDDLLSLSRVELEQHIRPTETLSVLEVIDAVGRSFESRLQARGMSIKIDARAFTSGPVADNPPRCQGNHDEITEVFVNIIENAIKYGARDSDIDITVGYDDVALVKVDITNRGEGIEARHIPRLTERFYRVDKARSRKIGGTGLGLAIVKHILTRHQGRLDIASVPHKHTTFSVTLPILVDAPE